MAEKFYDFQQAALGNVPGYISLRRNSVAADYQIAESGGLKFLRYLSASSSSAKAASYNQIPSSGVSEAYAEVADIEGSVPSSARLVLFASDSPDNEYGAYYQDGFGFVIYRRVGGAFTELTRRSADIPTGIPYKLLFKVYPGSPPETPNILQSKVWQASQEEPATWMSETSDGALTLTSGWAGHVGFTQNQEVRYLAAGFGTDGDPAPREPITNPAQLITASSINSAEQFGVVSISPSSASVLAPGIESAEQFGSIGLVAVAVSIQFSGIPSAELVSPMAFYPGGSAIFAESIATAEQFGDASFMPGPVSIAVVAIASESIVSSPEFIAGPAVIYADSVPSAELFGDLTLFNVQQLIRLVGIDTAEAFGSTTIEGGADLSGWLTGRLNIKPALTASVGVNRVH